MVNQLESPSRQCLRGIQCVRCLATRTPSRGF